VLLRCGDHKNTEPVDLDALDKWARAEVKAAQERRAALREAKREAGLAKLRAQEAEDALAAARAQIAALEAARAEAEAARAAAAAEKAELAGELAAQGAELAETVAKNQQWQEVAVKKMRASSLAKSMTQASGDRELTLY